MVMVPVLPSYETRVDLSNEISWLPSQSLTNMQPFGRPGGVRSPKHYIGTMSTESRSGDRLVKVAEETSSISGTIRPRVPPYAWW